MDQLEYVVLKRQSTFDYLKRAHHGSLYWLNVVKITKRDILQYHTRHPHDPIVWAKRIEELFLLGLSMGKLLELPNGPMIVRAFAQLMEEHEHFLTHGMKQRRASQTARTTLQPHNSLDPIKPAIRKVGKTIVYEHLETPEVSSTLDYCEVVYSLCEVLILVYSKFLDPSCALPMYVDAILKVDAKIKQLIVNVLVLDLTNIATPLMKESIRQLTEFSSASDPDQRRQSAHFGPYAAGPAQYSAVEAAATRTPTG